jgi:hypothetical protein
MGDKIHKAGPDGHGNELYVFHCPGCGYGHNVPVPRWTWNGSLDKPTFSPSLDVNKQHPEYRCHSFIKDGQIQFMNDSCHKLKGQTVDLPDWDCE